MMILLDEGEYVSAGAGRKIIKAALFRVDGERWRVFFFQRRERPVFPSALLKARVLGNIVEYIDAVEKFRDVHGRSPP